MTDRLTVLAEIVDGTDVLYRGSALGEACDSMVLMVLPCSLRLRCLDVTKPLGRLLPASTVRQFLCCCEPRRRAVDANQAQGISGVRCRLQPADRANPGEDDRRRVGFPGKSPPSPLMCVRGNAVFSENRFSGAKNFPGKGGKRWGKNQ